MPRCCATILDPTDGTVLAYAEVYVKDPAGAEAAAPAAPAAPAAAAPAAAPPTDPGTVQAIAAATQMCQKLYPGQPVPPVKTKKINGKAKGVNFPPPSN